MTNHFEVWQTALRSKNTFYGSFIVVALYGGIFFVQGFISLIFTITFLCFALGRAADIEPLKIDTLHIVFSLLYGLSAISFSYSWGMVSGIDFEGGVLIYPKGTIAENLNYGWLIILGVVYIIPTIGFLSSPATSKPEVSRKKADTIGRRFDVWIVLFIILNVLLLLL